MMFFKTLMPFILLILVGSGCRKNSDVKYDESPQIGHRLLVKNVYLSLSSSHEFDVKDVGDILNCSLNSQPAVYDIFSGDDLTSASKENDGMFVTYLTNISDYLSRAIRNEENSSLKKTEIACLLIKICYKISKFNPPKTFKWYYFDHRMGKMALDVPGDFGWRKWEICVQSWSLALYYPLQKMSEKKALPHQYERIYRQLEYIKLLGDKHAVKDLQLLKQIHGLPWKSQKYLYWQKTAALELREQIKKLNFIMMEDLKCAK